MVNRLYLSLKEVGQEYSDELSEFPSMTCIDHRKHEAIELQVMLSTDVTSIVRFVLGLPRLIPRR